MLIKKVDHTLQTAADFVQWRTEVIMSTFSCSRLEALEYQMTWVVTLGIPRTQVHLIQDLIKEVKERTKYGPVGSELNGGEG